MTQFAKWANDPHVPEWRTINAELLRCEQDIMESSFQVDASHLKRYIHYHLAELKRISEVLCESINEGAGTDVRTVFDNPKFNLVKALEFLLEFMTSHFREHVDLNLEVSHCLYNRFQDKLKKERQKWNEHLTEVDNYFIQLFTRLFSPINNSEDLTLEQLQFIKDLFNEVELLINYNKVITDLHLIIILLRLNYNDPQFIEHIKLFINERVYNRETLEHQLQVLEDFFHDFTNLNVTPVGIKISVRDIIIKWLLREIEEKKNEISAIDIYNIPQEDQLGKLETSLNVKELALMIRISFAAAVFVNRNLSQLIQLMAYRVSTVATNIAKNISPKNLRNSLYIYDAATFDTVGNVLKRMQEKYQQIKKIELSRKKEREV